MGASVAHVHKHTNKHLQTNLSNKQIPKEHKMKKERKRQDDRVLKRLPQNERRKQVRLRRQIMSDPLFSLA
jgi:hypothetical protein